LASKGFFFGLSLSRNKKRSVIIGEKIILRKKTPQKPILVRIPKSPVMAASIKYGITNSSIIANFL
jgi:hypothetical protein